jgi:serine/threonine-protein kinase
VRTVRNLHEPDQPAQPASAHIEEQLERILSSRAFSHAQRLRTMLGFIVKETLAGRASELKETVIGTEVCGRASSFDPKTDPIVRVDANRLRTRLQSYYESEGIADPVRISLPKGSYVPDFRLSGGVLQPPAAQHAAIAVLPFVNLSGLSEHEFFADSLTEQIIHRLSAHEGLRVIGRGSAFQFKGRAADIRAVGQKLGVTHVLDGTVRVLDARLRITVQMSDATTSYVLWSERYERPWERVLDVEEEIAASVTDALRVRLDSRSRAVLAPPTENAEAYSCYLRGRYLWNQRTPESLEASLRAFEEAVRHDPRFAAAYAGITDTLIVMALNDQICTPEAARSARAAARQAVELQPDSPDALVSFAAAKAVFDWDWNGGESNMRQALRYNAGSAAAHYLYAILILQPHGRWDEAFREMNTALRLDPVSPVLLRDYGMLHFMRRDWKSAEETYNRLEDTVPGFRGALYWRSRLAIEQGRPDQALQLLGMRMAAGRANTRVRATVAYALARSGQGSSARAILEELRNNPATPPLDIATIFLGLDRPDEALDFLSKACEQRSAPLYQYAVDPVYDPVRSHDRGEAIRRLIGLPEVITSR